jgi:hypothetical protein
MSTPVVSSRRAALVGVAAAMLPMSLPAMAGPDEADAALASLYARLPALEERERAAVRLFQVAEATMIAWRRQNPRPEMRECAVGTCAEAAMAEQAAAWESREAAARKTCNFSSLKSALEDAIDAVNQLCDEAMRLAPRTLAGLQTKARFAKYGADIAESIVADLLAL